jgi:hypothetical protein
MNGMEGLIMLGGISLAILLAFAMQTPGLLTGRNDRR